MTKLEVITGSGNTSTTGPLILWESYYVVKYFRSDKNGDSGWQTSMSHIYPKFKFPANNLEDAIRKANTYAASLSQDKVGYEVIGLYKVQDVINVPKTLIANMTLADKIGSEFEPF